MLQGIVIRGTTPLHEFELPFPLEIIKDIRVIYGQNNKPLFIKTKNECSLQEGKFSVRLTQEDTFSLNARKKLYIEIRIKATDGQVLRTEDPIILRVLDTMDEEVMN